MDRKQFISMVGMLPALGFVVKNKKTEKEGILEPTCDPYVFIEEKRIGYIRYREVVNGKITRRWEVHGICTGIGKCYEGANGEKPILDCPVSPEFKKDCCKLKVKTL